VELELTSRTRSRSGLSSRERFVGVEVEDEGGVEEVVVQVALRQRRVMRCSGCSRRVRVAYDSRPGSWRHLDLGRVRCVIRCEVRRVCCPECGIRTEAVPWARPGSRQCPGCGVRVESVPWARAGSRFTRAFEDTCVYLVKAAPKTTVAALMRVDWHTVGRMIERVVAEHAAARDGDGLDGLTRIGIDEVAYRKGHRYLMCVTDHGSGGPGVGGPGQKPDDRRGVLHGPWPRALQPAGGGVVGSSRWVDQRDSRLRPPQR
jgi:transposase